jgi:hypothetical protein
LIPEFIITFSGIEDENEVLDLAEMIPVKRIVEISE